MDALVRAAAMYLFLLLAFRIAGKRALSQATTFDLLLLLIISETTQQAMVGDDNSMTHAFLLITSFLAIEVLLSFLKQKYKPLDRLLEGEPVLLVEHGKAIRRVMDRMRVDEEDILEAARATRGLERMEQIKYAVLERTGKISIVPDDAR